MSVTTRKGTEDSGFIVETNREDPMNDGHVDRSVSVPMMVRDGRGLIS